MRDEKEEKAASHGRPRNPATDEAILKAALELFIESGIDGTSIEKIARRAQTNRAAIYRRYANKEEMLAAALDQLRRPAEQVLASHPGLTLEAVLDAISRPEVAKLFVDDSSRRLLARLMGSVADGPELMAIYRQSYIEPRRDLMSRVLDDARAAGVLPPDCDTDIIQDMLAGAVIIRLLLHPAPPTEREMGAYLTRLVKQLGLKR